MFGGTLGIVHVNKEGVEFVYFNHGSKAFMVIPTERKAHFQLQKSAQQPMLGMPMQTTPLQQSTSMQPVLTPANTVAHTRSSPQQPINQRVARQPTTPQQQVDPAQLLDMFLNQLAISGQLTLHQPAPSVGQLIRQTPPMTG
jgi:hypothetical protein